MSVVVENVFLKMSSIIKLTMRPSLSFPSSDVYTRSTFPSITIQPSQLKNVEHSSLVEPSSKVILPLEGVLS